MSKQETEKLSDSILIMNEAISHVAILDNSNRLLQFSSRNTTNEEIPIEVLREFASVGPLIALGAMERLQSFSGHIEYLVTKCEKNFLVICNLQKHIVVLVLDSNVDMQVIENIAKALRL